MITVVITNKKGGVGKTTTAYNLAAMLQERGYKTLAIDLDPQCSLTKMAGLTNHAGPSSYGVIAKEVKCRDAIIPMGFFDLIPGSKSLISAENTLPEGIGRLMRVRDALTEVKDDYDFAVLDNAPAMGVIAINSLMAGNYVVIPAEANELSTDGIISVYESITDMKNYMETNIKIAGILLTRYKTKTNLNQEYLKIFRKLAKEMNTKVFKQPIRESVGLSEMPSVHLPIHKHRPHSNAHLDYNVFVEELLDEVKKDVNNHG